MQDVQKVDSATATPPRAQLVDTGGRPMIHMAQTAELHEALNSLATLGIRKLGYRFRFFDDGSVTWQFTARHGAGRNPSVLPAIKAARHRLGQLLEEAIRDATAEFMGLDRELHYECAAAFKPSSGSWRLSGRGTIFEISPDFFDVGITLE